MSRVLIGNLPPGTTIRNIDDFCSPFGRLLYVDVKNQGKATLACVEYDSVRNAYNLVRARHGYNFNGYTVQLKVMSGDSGPFEVRDDSRLQNSPPPPPPPMWSNNSQSNNRMFNNNSNSRMQGQSSNFDNNRGNNYFDNSNSGPGPSMNNSSNLDYNQACRIVYERFINEGYNPQVAKERTLEFVSNMQGGNNQGFNTSNSDYFGQSQGINSNNFGNNLDNWEGNNFQGNQQTFSNSNWGNFSGPNNQQMSSSWGGGARGGGGMSYPQQSSSARWNNGGNRYDSMSGRGGNALNAMQNTVPRGVKPGPCVDHERYLQSATIRKKIEAKITKGISTPRDLKNLQFHTQIMDDYERNARLQNKVPKKDAPNDQFQKLQRYKSALGIVQKYKKLPQSKLTPEDRNLLIKNKSIVDEYEKSIAVSRKAKGAVAATSGKIAAAYERKKQQLLKESKKNYPYDFRLSGAAKKKMRSLVSVGVETNEAKLLALHSSLVVQELISMKNAIKNTTAANGADKSKQLVPVGPNAKSGAAKSAGAKSTGAKPTGAKPKQPVTAKPAQHNVGKLKDMTKKERDGMRSANRLVFRYESKNADIESLTDRDIALLRMSLRRLQVYHEKYDTPVRKTKYDILLSEKYDKKETDLVNKSEKVNEKDQTNQEVLKESKEDVAVEGEEVADAEVDEGGEGEEVYDEEMGDEEQEEEQ